MTPTIKVATKAALYLRVSTAGDRQTTENQRRELEAAAERNGWTVVTIFDEVGVSGSKERRPELDKLRRAIARKEVDVVLAWSVDRLGRSLTHLLALLGEMKAKGVRLYLHQQGLDTGTPAGEAMFQMLGVFAQFERAMILERIHSGLARARAHGTKSGRPMGRPRVPEKVEREIKKRIASKQGLTSISKELHVGVSTIMRIKKEVVCNG